MTATTPTSEPGQAGRSRATTPRAHVIGLGLALVAWGATGTVLMLQPQVPGDRFLLISTTLAFVCGAIVVLRTDTRLIGWLLVGAGVLWPLVSVYFADGPNPPPDTAWSSFLSELGEVGNSCVMLLLLVFPTGRFDSRAARIGAWITVGVSVTLPLRLLHALGVIGPVPEIPFDLLITAFGTFIVLGLTMQIRRYRHRPRVEQLQIKWFLFAISTWLAYPVILLLDIPLGAAVDIAITGTIPVAVLVAITRYRLYEIDRIVSRTVAYALVVAVLAILGVGGVTAITSLLPTQDSLAVALSTIAVVALFDPLRRRVVDAVDRRFDRTRYVARQVVEGFGRDVQDVTDLDEIGDRVHAVIGRTVAPTTVAVWQPPGQTS